jgi:hypothetical protein
VKIGGAEYIALLAEKLADLAIARVPELSILKPGNGKPSPLFDFIVSTDSGACFLVKIASYSAFQLKIEPDPIPVLELEVETDYLRAAQRSPTPVVMFLFDGDRGHGRFLRLDTLPKPVGDAKSAGLSFPIENTITGTSIRALATELAKEREVPVAG